MSSAVVKTKTRDFSLGFCDLQRCDSNSLKLPLLKVSFIRSNYQQIDYCTMMRKNRF